VPVVVQGRTVASFSLDAIHAARHFSQSEVKLGQVLAAQLAVAIENARLYQALQTEQEYLQSLYRASSIIIAPREPGDVLQSVLNLAHQVTGAWRAVVLLGDAGAFPHALLSAGFAYSLDRQTSIRAYGISQQVLASGMARFVPDTQVETADVHPAMLQDGVRAAACLPLQLQGQTIGVLWLHFRETHAFSDNERRALEFYANQSAIAYDMSRRIEELEQLRSAIAAMTRPSDIRDVLQEIVSGAKTVLKADYTLIWSYDEIRDVFLPEELVAEGIPGPWLERFRQEEPRTGKTTRYILSHEYLHVPLLAEADPYVVGNPTRQSLTALGVESFHGIRLDVAGEKLGVLFADYKQPQGFTEEARRVLGTFASHAALALKKARLLDQIRKARNAAGTLAEIGVLERDVARVCDQIVRGAQDALGCDAVTLYRYDEETGELGYPPAMSSGVRYPERATSLPEVLTDSIVWQILRAAELTIIDDTDSNELTRGRRFTVDEDVRSLVGVPLRVQGRNVGVMFVNYRSNHRFTDDEITNIRLFSNQTAVIIRNAQLHEQIQRHNEALEALYQAGTIITGTLTLKRVLERILEQTLKITRISDEHIGYSYIALVEDSILHYVTASSRDVLQELRNRGATHDLRRGTPPRGIATRAALEGTTQNVNDVRADPDYIPLRVYIHSQLSVPLEVSGHVIGVLSIEHSKVGAFTSEDRRNIELLAAQAAIAIQNATRFDDLKRIKALVGTKTATDWMRMVSVAWGHAVRKKVGIAVNYLDLAEMDRAAGDDHGVRQDIGSLRAALAEIAEIPIIAPLAREDSVESVQINDLVRKHLKYRWQSEPFTSIRLQRDLQSDLDALASVRASPAWLTRALEILLDNAEQAMSQAQSPERSITVGTKLVDNMIEISVRDTGPGIDAALLPRLGFDPVEKQPGTRGAGLGLLQAKLITQTYGGDLNVYSEPTGATLVIVLPIELPV
jgi:GAF domain-containing protein